MYCPKCATENPDDGRFCRKCGMGLPQLSQDGSEFELERWVNDKLAPRFSGPHQNAKRKGKEATWEAAIGSIGAGLAFVIISIILAFQPMGTGWWFWMLIPGFGALGAGIAQVIRLRQQERRNVSFSGGVQEREISSPDREALPPKQTAFAEEEFSVPKRTADFAPPSVTEGTTRHLEMSEEGETTKLKED